MMTHLTQPVIGMNSLILCTKLAGMAVYRGGRSTGPIGNSLRVFWGNFERFDTH